VIGPRPDIRPKVILQQTCPRDFLHLLLAMDATISAELCFVDGLGVQSGARLLKGAAFVGVALMDYLLVCSVSVSLRVIILLCTFPHWEVRVRGIFGSLCGI
jgi:hypothetical protein